MRTGKLIYDDSYALNSLAGPSVASPSGGGTEYQLQEPMYQRPYDTGSIRSAINHNITTEYGPQSSRYHHIHHNMRAHEPASYMSADYMTDATTDHYENPNFDLRTNSTGAVGVVGVAVMQNQAKNTVSSGSASGSGSGSGSSGTSGTSQQQMLLLQSDSCYSEPLQENSSYEFNNFERPVFQEKSIDSIPHSTDECWPEREKEGRKITKNRDKKHNTPSVCNEFPLKQHQMKQQQKPYHHSQQHYNSEEDEDDEDIISGSNHQEIWNHNHAFRIA
ncbi:hypothetical protein AWZ03_013669 [Drosophila navojoa]|uniref:Uncharacterized protein n=1 Tax=Drosophila navojoa TaxID=7232 RepID=A0A484ATH4_DRONA|nr:hypothetical protein AWZ03_013669 [Drosophila navojoa]